MKNDPDMATNPTALSGSFILRHEIRVDSLFAYT